MTMVFQHKINVKERTGREGDESEKEGRRRRQKNKPVYLGDCKKGENQKWEVGKKNIFVLLPRLQGSSPILRGRRKVNHN